MPADPNIYDIGDAITLEAVFLTAATRGSIAAGQNTLTVKDASGFAATDPILVVGAGPLGADLETTVSSVSGSAIVLAATAGTQVASAIVGKPTQGTVSCKIHLPDGTSATPTVTNPSTGRYQATFSPTQEGSHFYRFASSAGVIGAEEGQFVVRERRVI